MERLLLRPDEAAELIGMGRSKMYMLIKDGTLPSIRLGRSVRVPLRALQDWVNAMTEQAKGERTPFG